MNSNLALDLKQLWIMDMDISATAAACPEAKGSFEGNT